METVSFTAMKDGTKEDYEFLRGFEHEHNSETANRVLRELRLQDEETFPGYKISRLGHALQAATRAYREGADKDWVAAALLHDIGDGLAPQNHDRFAAEVLQALPARGSHLDGRAPRRLPDVLLCASLWLEPA